MARDYPQTTWDDHVEQDARQLVRLAVREDLHSRFDWTTVALVPAACDGRAHVVARQEGVAAGMQLIPLLFDEMECRLQVDLHRQDGDAVPSGDVLATVHGSARDLLTTERILLNFLGRLCGIATQTAKFVQAIEGTGAAVYDTRKTTPGWRLLEKYAVRCGGGRNHRQGLDAAVMVKDNHLACAQEVLTGFAPVDAVRTIRSFLNASDLDDLIVEIEVDSLSMLDTLLAEAPDIVLLDNMSTDQLTEAVGLRDRLNPAVQLEASGGVTLDNIQAIAATGVERISCGALTHSAAHLDLGLDWTNSAAASANP